MMGRMKSIHTTPGRLYALASSADCSVTTPDDRILGTSQAGQQLIFAATHAELSLSDDSAIAVPVGGQAAFLLDPVPGKRAVFAPDGTADDVIIMSDNNTVATFRWPNRLICNTNSDLGIPSSVKSITGEAPQLIHADNMFQSQAGSFEFSVSMPELRYAYGMFQKSGITKFESDISHLKDGSYMFAGASLTEFTASLDRLENGDHMFDGSKISSADLDLPSATSIKQMFVGCGSLTSLRLRAPLVSSVQSLCFNTGLIDAEISLVKATSVPMLLALGKGPSTLRLCLPLIETFNFEDNTTSLGKVETLATLQFFSDTDADGVLYGGLENAKTIKFYDYNTALTAESVQHIVDTVTDWSTSTGVSALLQIPTGKLTEEQKATLAAKGWTYTEV